MTTSNGRQPQNIKSGISQQLMIGSLSNVKVFYGGNMKKTQRKSQVWLCSAQLVFESLN
jgi:hypothetical protein